MAAVKDEISPSLVAALAADIADVWPSFDRARFEHLALDGIGERELKARVTLVAQALAMTLPGDAAHSDRVIRGALGRGGLRAWASLPVSEYVAATMLDQPDIGLRLLAALTSRFSAEFAVRAFIEHDAARAMAYLDRWVGDPDEHVRRLVSEGTRPRLPWAPLLRDFVADPTLTLALLERLFDDDSDYVRRSVANHLNDISKDHPDLAVDTAARWATRSARGAAVARHGLRTLVKKGHPGALAVLGFGTSDDVEVVAFECQPTTIAIGAATTIACTLVAVTDLRAAIDYRVHYQGANGLNAPKVFKLAVRELRAGQPVTVTRAHAFEHVSIRRIHPGRHRVDVQVNGRVAATADIDVTSDV